MRIIELIKNLFQRNQIPSKRRGLYTTKYTMMNTVSNTANGYINVEYELEEIERTPTKSKVKVISYVTDKGQLPKSQMKDIEVLINNKWMDSKWIEWIEKDESLSEKREKKINQILK